MKYVIDIDSYVLEHCKRHVEEHYANNIEEAIANATPLEEVLEDIKSEINELNDSITFNIGESKAKYTNIGQSNGFEQALEIIDKYISGKE